MSTRRSLKLPITLGVLMIVALVALAVGWVLLSLFGVQADQKWAPLYWALLSVGTAFLVFVLVGVVVYLTLSIKAINLTRRQSNFIDSVTHELKSPIASLKLYLQTLDRRQVSPQERADFQRFMMEDVERLDQLINDLLDAARLEKPSAEVAAEEVDLAQLLQQCVVSVSLRYRSSPDTFATELEPCLITAQQVDLEVIFRNLIDNAVKYGGDDPRVEVRLKNVDNKTAVVRISDNGNGIPKKMRRKIFGRFVRLGLELERKKPGTGLGLYIVRTLIRRLRGSIEVKDPEQGTGTVFEVRIPIRDKEAENKNGSLIYEKPPPTATETVPKTTA